MGLRLHAGPFDRLGFGCVAFPLPLPVRYRQLVGDQSEEVVGQGPRLPEGPPERGPLGRVAGDREEIPPRQPGSAEVAEPKTERDQVISDGLCVLIQ